ncbi:MAG: asparagine synthase-related protein [Propionicimonas sp.]|nr:asparagine synthase-related protein [Propionicimonas sp.]
MQPVDLSADFARLSDWERLISFPVAERRWPTRGGQDAPRESARVTLERLLLPAVTQPPCYILFSGGRDSSSLLGVATLVARRAGADDPVPVTVVHPDAPRTDESQWQSTVLSHLGLAHRIVLESRGDQSLLSPDAQAALGRHGLVWPEALQVHGFVLGQLPTGTVVMGEGGDDTLGNRRVSPLWRVLRARRLRRADAGPVVGALAPRAAHRGWARRRVERAGLLAWLRPPHRDRALRDLAAGTSEPLRWDRAVAGSLLRRPARILRQNLETTIAEYGHRPVNPFLDQEFALALAATGGPVGLGDRTTMMRRLFGDLLPPAVLGRQDKAAFGDTRWGSVERDFARSWSGAGLGDEVDPEVLRAAWLSDFPPPGAAFLLHAAWLASVDGATA